MKNCILLFSLFFQIQFALAQDTSYYNSNWKPCSKSIASYARISQIGNAGYMVKDYYYPSMAIQMTGAYEDKKLEYKTGEFIYYSENGKVSSSCYYELDELNGWNVNYEKNGYVMDSVFYIRGIKENARKVFHNNENLWYIENYKDDLLNDTIFTFYPNGKIKRVEVYKENILQTGFCLDSTGNKTNFTPLVQMPKFSGGESKFNEWLYTNIKYPKSKQREGMEGLVKVKFTLDTLGKPIQFLIDESNDTAFSIAAISAMEKMPNWSPLIIDDVKTSINLRVPIKFLLEDNRKNYNYFSEEYDELKINDEPVYIDAMEMPEFKGGSSRLTNFLAENLQYPEIAIENGVEGTVNVSFIVLKNGEIARIKLLNKVGWGIDEESIRLVKAMPKWNPGKRDGIPVNIRISIPIKFRFNEAK